VNSSCISTTTVAPVGVEEKAEVEVVAVELTLLAWIVLNFTVGSMTSADTCTAGGTVSTVAFFQPAVCSPASSQPATAMLSLRLSPPKPLKLPTPMP
jgi:hypothetical protein